MNIKFKKLRLILALLIVATFFSSCYSQRELPKKEAPFTPVPSISDDAIVYKEIRMVLVSDDFVMESWPVIEELYKLSGIKAYFKTIRPHAYTDTVGRILSNSETYDMIELDISNALLYKERLLDITPFVEEWAPNYLNWALKFPDFATSYYNNQPITYFPFREETEKLSGLAFIVPDSKAGDSLTLEDYYSFMENKTLSYRGSTLDLVEIFAPYFGTSTYWYTVNGTNNYGPTTNEFKFMLQELNDMYTKGIIPDDFEFAPPSNFTEPIANKTAGIALTLENDYEYVHSYGYRPVMLNFNENSYAPSKAYGQVKYGAILVGTGKEYDVLKFIDTCFSKEGRTLLNYGIEGVHSKGHEDGIIEYFDPFTYSGTYQWHQQGLTPEGLPGIYYNSWARFNEDLLNEIIPARENMAKSNFLIPPSKVTYTALQPKIITQSRIKALQQQWWTDFIKGEKSVTTDWNNYVSEMTNGGCYQGYLD